MPSVLSSGKSSRASAGEIRLTSKPKLLAVVTRRLSSAQRSSLAATLTLPTGRQPVA